MHNWCQRSEIDQEFPLFGIRALGAFYARYWCHSGCVLPPTTTVDRLADLAIRNVDMGLRRPVIETTWLWVCRVCAAVLRGGCLLGVCVLLCGVADAAETEGPVGSTASTNEFLSVEQFFARAAQMGQGTKVRLKGTVTFVFPDGGAFIQEDHLGVMVQEAVKGEPLKLGDAVQATGEIWMGGILPMVTGAKIHVVGRGTLPPPLLISGTEAMSGKYSMSLVRIRGRLLEGGMVGNWMMLMKPDDGGPTVAVDAGNVRDGVSLTRLPAGAWIEVTGIVTRRRGLNGEPIGVRLQPRSVEDVVTLGDPPFWSFRRTAQGLGTVSACLLLSLVWVVTLRRQVRRQMGLIEQRLEREAALRASEDRFAKIFKASPDSLLIVRASDFHILDVNPSFERQTGFTRAEVLGKTSKNLNLWVDDVEREEGLRQLHAYGHIRNYQCRARLKSGHIVTCLGSTESVELNGERCLLTVMRDITELKEAELALRRNEQRLRRAQSIAQIAHWTYDVKTDRCEAPDSDLGILGWTGTSMSFAQLLDSIQPSDLDTFKSAWNLLLGGEAKEVEYRITATGETRWLHTKGEAERSHQGVVERIEAVSQDTTDRKRAEETLREREMLFRAVAYQIPDSLFLIDIEDTEVPGRILYANDSAARAHGMALSEILGKSIRDLDAASTAAEVPARLQELRSGETVRFVGEHRRKDGSVFPVEVVARPLLELGRPIVLAIDRDISDRRKAEALSNGQKGVLEMIAGGESLPSTLDTLLRVVEEQSPEMHGSILLIDDTGAHLRHGAAPSLSSEYTHAVDGVPVGDGQGSCGTAAFWRKRIFVDDIETDPLWVNYKRLALKEGLHACWSTPILDAQERLLGTFAIYYKTKRLPTSPELRLVEMATHTAEVCITRHQAEQALRQSRERFATLVSSVDGVVWEADASSGRYLFVSQAAERVLGYLTEEWLAPGFRSQHVHPEDSNKVDAFYREVGVRGNAREIEYRMVGKDGRVVWVQDLVTVSMEQNDPKVVRGLLLDITHRKQVEEEQKQIQIRLRRSERMESLGTLAGGIAHDFNNLLGVILGNAELLQFQIGREELAQVSVSEVRGAALRARDLVRQILAFSREQPAQLRPISLGPVVDEAARLLRATIPTTIGIRTELSPDCPAVMADPVQIHQVLLNLGTNAWHAMETKPGQIVIALGELNVDAGMHRGSPHLPAGRYVHLSVKDQGVGMDATTRERMFDPFFTTKEVGKGTGLGLSIVQRIVASHGGTIDVTTVPGIGTSIDLYFPARGFESSGPGPTPTVVRNPATRAGRILLIDDELSLVNLAKRALGKVGHSVEGFTQPSLALDRFREDPQAFDLVVTDLNMPGLSGMDVIDAIRQQRPDIPIVLGSGFITDELRADLMQRGVHEVFYKPCTLKELAEIVDRALAPAFTA